MKKGHIYFIMGISGSGKGTLIRNIKALQGPRFLFPCSYVTRMMREGERDGDSYKFISQWDFLNSVEAWEFLEYAFVHNTAYYGTKMRDVYDEGIEKWKIVIKEIDVQWIEKVRQEYPLFDQYYSLVFLNIPKDKLRYRIEERGVFMSDEEFKKRMNSAEIEEEALSHIADYQIDATLSQEEVLQQFLEIVWERH
jgi:guanylate kinase